MLVRIYEYDLLRNKKDIRMIKNMGGLLRTENYETDWSEEMNFKSACLVGIHLARFSISSFLV